MNTTPESGMRERYLRAEAMLHRNVKSLVFNLETPVSWLPDSSAFWYRSEWASGQRFMLVEAATGRQWEAFDHRGVARVLSGALGRDIRPDGLPFGTIEFTSRSSRIRFEFDGQRWECGFDGSGLAALPDIAPTGGQGSLSPSGRYEARIDAGNLVLVDHLKGSSTALTDDAEPAHGYGKSPEGRNSAVTDRLRNREVPPRVAWSPDERYLLTHLLDERRVDMLHLLHGAPEGSLRPRVHSYRQALPGDTELPLAQMVVFELVTGRSTDLRRRPLPSPFLTPIELDHVW
ncbi:MAG: hypothetical protein F4Z79_07485, partial [Acidimicrobiia bacterium]|nr:hypothetical protein [Acidimicrobiia bacterium]